ncbi:GD17773 [Drosophila simulans]|uniref:GD17773 n=1 Tax=Drosophila simulans TaxID=7240 RepID=B4QVM5_DROSI|nr:GD17773 [Drosophila simulans]
MQIAQIVYALSFAHRFDFVILLYILRLICSSPPSLPSSVSLCVCECVRRHALALVLSLSRTCSAVCSLLRVSFLFVLFLNRLFIFSRS